MSGKNGYAKMMRIYLRREMLRSQIDHHARIL
jgi:hypothetical protein